MKSLRPEQVLLLLVVVLVPLLNLLVRWLQRRAHEAKRPARPESRTTARGESAPAPRPPQTRVIEPALSREDPRKAPPAPPPQPVRRAAPLVGRSALRRAVVAMTILGPCRALEEPTPTRPVRPPLRKRPAGQ